MLSWRCNGSKITKKISIKAEVWLWWGMDWMIFPVFKKPVLEYRSMQNPSSISKPPISSCCHRICTRFPPWLNSSTEATLSSKSTSFGPLHIICQLCPLSQDCSIPMGWQYRLCGRVWPWVALPFWWLGFLTCLHCSGMIMSLQVLISKLRLYRMKMSQWASELREH